MDNITTSEAAGLAIGALLFFATAAAPKVDAFISSSQTSNLGMCKRCGDLKMIACSKCRWVPVAFGLALLEDGFSRLIKEQQQQNLFPAPNVKLKVDLNVRFCSNN